MCPSHFSLYAFLKFSLLLSLTTYRVPLVSPDLRVLLDSVVLLVCPDKGEREVSLVCLELL